MRTTTTLVARLAIVVALACAWLLAPAAEAATPAPTYSVTMDAYTFDASKPEFVTSPVDAPLFDASWTIASPGKDATFAVSGTAGGTPVHVKALWTSNPVVVKPGRLLGRATLTWTVIQFEPSGINVQAVRVRFTNKSGRWLAWRTIAADELSTYPPNTAQQSLIVPLKYVGTVNGASVRMQVQLIDELQRAARVQHSMRVKLG